MKTILVAIVCITAIELVALAKGVNGTILTLVVGTVAGLGGLATKRPAILRRFEHGS